MLSHSAPLSICLPGISRSCVSVSPSTRAAQIRFITLTWSDQQLQVQIADDGRGFIPQEARGRGYGLLHMRERVAALQGELDIKSRPGGGTTITCTCPLQLSERGAENA